MPLSAPQIERLARSFKLFANDPDDLRTSFEAEMSHRDARCPSASARIIAELFELARNAAETDAPPFNAQALDRASWGAEEHALLAAVANACDYTWTNRLEADWALLVACAVQRATNTRAVA